MIYAITTGDNVVALTDDANAAERLNASGKHGVLTCRWASESERLRFRELAARHERKRWPVRHWLAVALWWLWHISFPSMLHPRG
jgi:hypothetical protein